MNTNRLLFDMVSVPLIVLAACSSTPQPFRKTDVPVAGTVALATESTATNVPAHPLPLAEYVVRPGDSIAKVAREHGMTTDELLRANPQLRSGDHRTWKIGTVVRVSAAVPRTATVPTPTPPRSKTGVAWTTNVGNTNMPPIPTAVEALIPRLADIGWQSTIRYEPGGEDVVVLYRTPVIGHNDSLSYIEFFWVRDDDGTAFSMDRIFLGGRDGYAVDRVTVKEKEIVLHAREHQNGDPISTPTKRVDIVLRFGDGVINASSRGPSSTKTD